MVINDYFHGARSVIYMDMGDGFKAVGVANGISINEQPQNVDSAFVMGSMYSQANRVRNKTVTGTIKMFVIDLQDIVQKMNSYRVRDEVDPIKTVNGVKIRGDVGSKINIGLAGRIPKFDIMTRMEFGENLFSNQSDYLVLRGCKIVNLNFTIEANRYWQKNVEFIADMLEVDGD